MPEKGADGQSEAAAERQRNPEIQVQIAGAKADRISAETEKGGLGEIDLAAEAKNDGEAKDGDRIGCGLDEDMEDIVAEGDERRRRNDENGETRVSRGRQDAQRRRDTRLRRDAHAFSATRSPNKPCGRKIRKAINTRKAKPSL
jgi:hypothetical protein